MGTGKCYKCFLISLCLGELVVEHLPTHFQTVQGYFKDVAEESAYAC